MNAPPKKERRDYRDAQGKRLPGVTTVLGETLGWSKSALMAWAHKQGREGKDFVRTRDAAAVSGTLAHFLALDEYIGRGVKVPEDDDPFIDEEERKARRAAKKVAKWWDDSGYFRHALELPLTDSERGFGGTIDLIVADMNGDLWLADLKTGKSVYDEVVIQLGAYSALCGLHGKDIKGAFVIHANGDDDLPARTVAVPLKMLTMGATGFASLLWLYKNRKDFKLDIDSNGGTP